MASGPEPRAATSVTDWRALQARLRQLGERRLVLLEGGRTSAMAWLRRHLPELDADSGLWTGPADQCPDNRLTAIQPSSHRSWLGRELSVIVWDGWKGNPPDALAALSGTLQAGGLLFWLMPPLEQWPIFSDPDYARTGLDQAREHPFAARMARKLAADPDVIRVSPDHPCPLPPLRLPAPQTAFTVATTADQQALVQALVQFGLGRRRRPLVVTADRGRGKSAALGLAAAELLTQGRRQILVTAPTPDNVDTLFRHAREALASRLADAPGPETGHRELRTTDGASLRFLALADLLADRPAAEVVMVDEAAAIPAQTLKAILLGWPRVAYATTLHGYEGAGRGFAIRFREVLEHHTPHWQARTLTTPIRWIDGDPLERLVSDLFLLAANSPNGPRASPDTGPVTIEPWQPATATDTELAEAFAVLVDAHYRTTPADLRQWLDDPQNRSWRARMGNTTVGLLWAAREGGLEAGLAEQVTLGTRRLRGHLLPQSLASHSGFPEAARQRCLRVVRVAVVPEARRLGVGRRLVRAAERSVADEGLDSLGTSFGGSPELLAFWQSCGLPLVRIGLRREASSGEYPLQMLKGCTDSGQTLVHRLRHRLARHWLTLVPLNWPTLAPRLLSALTADLPPLAEPTADDVRDLRSFSEGHRGFRLMVPVLRELSLAPGVMSWLSAQPDAELWCRSVLQGQSWAELQRLGLSQGQREGEDRLRAMVRELLHNGPEL